MNAAFFQLERLENAHLLRLTSPDGTNRLTHACVLALTDAVDELRKNPVPVIIAGNPGFFSVGADLNEILALTGPQAYEFAIAGQTLMNAIASHSARVIAAIEGHCMGGGVDLALACHRRIGGPHAVFGHRGAALGLITGWGGTQRLPRLIGKGRALEILVAAEKIIAPRALEIGLVDAIAGDPVDEAVRRIRTPDSSSEMPRTTLC